MEKNQNFFSWSQ